MITDKQVEVFLDKLEEWLPPNTFNTICKHAIRESLEAAEQAAWQPIETAPRDGYPILGWHVAWGKYPREVYWTCHNEWNSETQPTHWRHLPESPKEDVTDE